MTPTVAGRHVVLLGYGAGLAMKIGSDDHFFSDI